jgi:hypothetical protein
VRGRGRGTLVIVAVAAGCASGGVPAGEVPGIEGRACSFAASSEQVAAWQARVDADASTGDAAAPRAPVELSVRYDDQGGLEWVRPLTPSAEAAELAGSLAASLPARVEPGPSFRLRLRPGAPAEALAGVACAVEHPRAREVLGAALRRADFSELNASAPGKLEFDLEVDVAPTGRPLRTRVRRRAGRAGAVERAVAEAAMRERYLPALHDGFPITGTYTFEVRIESRVRVIRRGG